MVEDKETLYIRVIGAIVLLCVIYIFVFYMLKTAGIINTPLWVQLTPHLAGIVSTSAIIRGLIEFFVKVKSVPKTLNKLIKRVDNMASGLIKVEKDVEHLKKDVDLMKTDIRHLSRCKNYKATA